MYDPSHAKMVEYQPEWASLPEFSSWLMPDPNSRSHALCSLCKLQLKATLTSLRRHAATRHPACAPLARRRPPEQRRLIYRLEWQKQSELKDWLRRSPLNPDFAFCRSCNKELRPSLSYLRRHAVCPLHRRRSWRQLAEEPGVSDLSVHGAVASVDTPDDSVDADGEAKEQEKHRARETKSLKTKGKRRVAETVDTWQRQSEFAPWLRRSAVDGRKAFCLVCYKEFTAKLAFVRRHAASSFHARRAASVASAIPERMSDERSAEAMSGGGLETVDACDSDLEWTPDGQADTASEDAAGGDKYRPELQPRRDAALSPSPAPSPAPDGGSAAEQPSRRVHRAVYNPAWERRPELADWLGRGPDRPRRAYCRVCQVEITPKLAHVRRHGASKRHLRNAQQTGQLQLSLPGSVQRAEEGPGTQNVVVEACFETDDTAGDNGTSDVTEGCAIVEDQHESNLDESAHRVPQTQNANDAAAVRPPFHRRRLSYQTLWEQELELRDWLRRSPWDQERPFCRWCRREVTAKLAHLRRHARSGLHRRARPAGAAAEDGDGTRRAKEGAQDGPGEGAEEVTQPAVDDGGDDEMAKESCQPAELGPFGTCLVCKHPLVMRLNIFRCRARPSRRLVAAVLSSMLQQPFSKESCEPSSSEICTACASLLDTAEELRTKLAAVEEEVKRKFSSPCPLPVPSRSGAEGSPAGDGGVQRRDQDPHRHRPDPEKGTGPVTVPGTAETLQGADMVLQGQPVAFITFGDADMERSEVVVRTETLENGDLVAYREPLELIQPQLPVGMFSNLSVPDEEPSQQSESEPVPGPRPSHPRRPKGAGLRRASHETIPRRPLSPGDQRSFDCVFCHCSFRTSLALHQHWNTEHPLQLKPCPHCPKRFLYTSSLKQHIRTHGTRAYACDKCGKQFAAKCDLKKHTIFVHSDVKRYPCDICGKAFKLKWMLGRHVRLVHEDGEN